MKDIDFEKHVFYKRFLVRFDDFKRTFLSNDVQKDLDCLPDCTKQDSLERWLEIYENAFLHFTGVIQDNDPRFIENYELLVDIYGEGVIYPTKRKIEYIKELLSLNTETTPLLPQQTGTKTDRLKVPQIALIHVYEGKQITRENAGEIAAKHGYTAKNSGEGLFQDYTKFCSMATRKGKPTPCTPQKLKNKIELFESVINHLSDNNKQRAIDEINILKTIFENEY